MSTITTTLGDIDAEIVPGPQNSAVAAWGSKTLVTVASGSVPHAEGFAVLKGNSFTHDRGGWDGVTSNHDTATRNEIAAAVELALDSEVTRARDVVRRARREAQLSKSAALRTRADTARAAADDFAEE